MKLRLLAVMILATAAVTAVRAGQATARSAKDGVYTTEQSDHGKIVYDEQCLSCHGNMATVTPDMAPLLNDGGFQNLWNERPLARLFSRIRETMPQNNPGSLSPEQTVDLIAYVLSANQLPAGDVALPSDLEVLKNIKLDAGGP